MAQLLLAAKSVRASLVGPAFLKRRLLIRGGARQEAQRRARHTNASQSRSIDPSETSASKQPRCKAASREMRLMFGGATRPWLLSSGSRAAQGLMAIPLVPACLQTPANLWPSESVSPHPARPLQPPPLPSELARPHVLSRRIPPYTRPGRRPDDSIEDGHLPAGDVANFRGRAGVHAAAALRRRGGKAPSGAETLPWESKLSTPPSGPRGDRQNPGHVTRNYPVE